MSDLIKKIKIKQQDGTFTDYIPIGAEAQNVSTSDGDSVQLKLNKKPYYYNSVADMKADTKLKTGDMAVTLGYYNVNDGGASEYKIVSTTSKYAETLNNNLKAELIVKDTWVYLEQLGCYGDGIHDDSNKINNALLYFNNFICEKEYLINSKIILHSVTNKIMDGKNIGKLIKTPSEGQEDYIFDISNVTNIKIKGLTLESTKQYSTLPRPDHPNWNNSISSNITGFWIHGEPCDFIEIEDIISHNLYRDILGNGGSDCIIDNITIKNYCSYNVTGTAFFFGWTLNAFLENIIVEHDALPLPGCHSFYTGRGAGNIFLKNAKFIGNQYIINSLNLQDASAQIGVVSSGIVNNVRIHDSLFIAPGNVLFKNEEIHAYFYNCTFLSMKSLQENNSLIWVAPLRSGGVTSGEYVFSNCNFNKYDLSDSTDYIDQLISNNTTATASFNEHFILNNCKIDNFKDLHYFGCLSKKITFNDCFININRRIFQKIQYEGSYMCNNCIINSDTNYLCSNTGTNAYDFILKDCYITTGQTGVLFNSDNANGYIKIYNTIINDPNKSSGWIGGSTQANTKYYNLIINDSELIQS